MTSAEERCKNVYRFMDDEALARPIRLIISALAFELRNKYWRITGVKLSDQEAKELAIAVVKRGVKELI